MTALWRPRTATPEDSVDVPAASGPGEEPAARLLAALGYQAPRADEAERIRARADLGPIPVPLEGARVFWVPATVLHSDPLISYSGLARGASLGVAGLLSGKPTKRARWFLLSPTWTLENTEVAQQLRARAVLHRHANPHHRLIFLCNTPEETAIVQQQGEAAFLYNKLANVRETIFRPLRDVPRDFDAIYNAQLIGWKRHELALGIERCGFLFYRDKGAAAASADDPVIRARHARLAPGHVFINATDAQGTPIRLRPEEINRHLNRAAVGLCLSEREGAMFASAEYLLSGLPIVTTPSVGGRHVYFEDDYCVTARPDAGDIAAAVKALGARNIPREYVRERTLRKFGVARRQFLSLLDQIVEASGRPAPFGDRWLFDQPVMMRWTRHGKATERALHGRVDAYSRRRLRFWTAAARSAVIGLIDRGTDTGPHGS